MHVETCGERRASHAICEKVLLSFEFVLVGQDHLIHILEMFLKFQEGVKAHRVVKFQLPTQFLGQGLRANFHVQFCVARVGVGAILEIDILLRHLLAVIINLTQMKD